MSTRGGLANGQNGDQGFTLVELLMVILIFGMVSAAVAAVTTSGLHHQRELQDRSDALASARTAVQRIDRDIRSTDQVYKATASMLLLQEEQFSGSTVTGSRWVCYYVDTANELVVVGETAPTDCSTSPSGTSKVLVSHLTNTASSPVFSYWQKTVYSAPGVTPGSCSVGGSPEAFAASCIGTITVHVLTKPSSLKQPVSVTDKGTELRNS
jgi:prepilin-type N-terminal cleavage/methylation domain-containing protein